ncbi:helix-hairpin-helix domain-containing protein [Geomesophilobacter sediminis]|uniref:Helix-hairpin-helix domain-containing protein n=1 Tax=Geomesophilobacter sediminis TaxID=2798584 RepID=A0A8J7LY89_9BACT|nr:helix-hairpin-helix domain-containing protein [Geomesophilobacter sediminis]MBJ6724312.1 helix-hairpin-helix domain-containing protein [Geomesophilobacter sediminis]
MAQATAELQHLKGIGKVLAQRLHGAGLGSFHGIVEAGEDGLKKIPGLNPASIPNILDQAKKLSHRVKQGKEERVAALQGKVTEVREMVGRVEERVRERFAEKLEGKSGKKVSADLNKVMAALTRMAEGEHSRFKRAERALDKTHRRVAKLEEAGLKKVRKGLKKSKKSLVKLFT